MKLIELTQGYQTIVDDEDYEWLNKWKWRVVDNKRGNIYATSAIKINRRTIRLHRLILGIDDPKVFIDHIDGNGLNNQKSNLRISNNSQNMANRTKRKDSRSSYKGVTPFTHGNKQYWNARCQKDRVMYSVNCKTEKEAAIAYNVMALGLHGEYAKLNVVENC